MQQERQPLDQTPRSPYQAPTLVRYGAVRDLTASGTFGRSEVLTGRSDPMTRM